jgi:hypothetical protein
MEEMGENWEKTMYCPFQTDRETYQDCDMNNCAIWIGDECAFKAMGRAAQQYCSDADFAESVALYAPAKDK